MAGKKKPNKKVVAAASEGVGKETRAKRQVSISKAGKAAIGAAQRKRWAAFQKAKKAGDKKTAAKLLGDRRKTKATKAA